MLGFGPFCLDLGYIAWIWAIWHNLGQNRPQRGQSPVEHRGLSSVCPFVRPPQALSGLKFALSGLQYALSGLRADFRPEMADFRPERADFRPERAWGDELTDERTDERTKVPCVLQDFVHFGAAALPIIPIYNQAKQGNGYC